MRERVLWVRNEVVWVDLEMTGLEPSDCILEVAVVLTTTNLEVLPDHVHRVVNVSEDRLAQMGSWCQHHHQKSGLLDEVRKSKLTIADVEKEVMELMQAHVVEGQAPLCGNSVHVDKRYIYNEMRRFHDYLNYRIIDVSSLKELYSVWSKDEPFKNLFLIIVRLMISMRQLRS